MYILEFSISFSISLCHLTKLLRHLIMIITCVSNMFSFYLKLMTRHESISFTFGLPVLRWLVSPIMIASVWCLTFPIRHIFLLKTYSKLKDTGTIYGLTKLNSKIYLYNKPSIIISQIDRLRAHLLCSSSREVHIGHVSQPEGHHLPADA